MFSMEDLDDEIWINAKMTASQTIAIEHQNSEEIPLEQRILETYHEYLDIFDEHKADRMLKPRKWDHAIELKKNFEGHRSKIYQLNVREKEAMNKFIDENLAKGYIHCYEREV